VAREWTFFAGALFTLMGISLAAAARRSAEDAPLPRGERVASACSRGMIALFLVFGLRLLREGLR